MGAHDDPLNTDIDDIIRFARNVVYRKDELNKLFFVLDMVGSDSSGEGETWGRNHCPWNSQPDPHTTLDNGVMRFDFV